MKVVNKKSLKAQAGVGLIQMALALSILAIVSFLAFQRYSEVQDDARNIAAFEEVTRWLGEMIGIGAVRAHIYSGLTQADILLQTSIDDATNVYGLPITVAPGGGGWILTYPFPFADACEYVAGRIVGHPGLTATPPACNGGNVLVATAE